MWAFKKAVLKTSSIDLNCSFIGNAEEIITTVPVNCVVSEWSDWSICDGETQTKTRVVITNASGGGTECPELTATQPCTVLLNCSFIGNVEEIITTVPVNCVVSEWSDWSICDGETQTKTRVVTTYASGGGTECPELTATQPCTVLLNCSFIGNAEEIPPTPPTQLYKITSFVQGNNTSQVECNSAAYYDYTEIIAFQLTEIDGITPKVNSTGANIVVNMLVNTSGCFGETGSYPLEIIILPGQSVVYGENRGITNNCGGWECTTETETFSCYTSIVPSGIEPTVDFFPKCSCVGYTVSTTSSSGQSFAYTNCDGTGAGPFNLGGVGGYDADTFCALEDSVVLTGAELNLTNNGPCP